MLVIGVKDCERPVGGSDVALCKFSFSTSKCSHLPFQCDKNTCKHGYFLDVCLMWSDLSFTNDYRYFFLSVVTVYSA